MRRNISRNLCPNNKINFPLFWSPSFFLKFIALSLPQNRHYLFCILPKPPTLLWMAYLLWVSYLRRNKQPPQKATNLPQNRHKPCFTRIRLGFSQTMPRPSKRRLPPTLVSLWSILHKSRRGTMGSREVLWKLRWGIGKKMLHSATTSSCYKHVTIRNWFEYLPSD